MRNPTPGAIRMRSTFVVSSDSWVARTTIVRTGCAAVFGTPEGDYWIASAGSVLSPSHRSLQIEAEAEGGPPQADSKVVLAKCDLVAPESGDSITLRRPEVVSDSEDFAAMIRIDGSISNANAIMHRAFGLCADPVLGEADRLLVLGLYSDADGTDWDIRRTVSYGSSPEGGFAGREPLVAIDASPDRFAEGAPIVDEGTMTPRGITAQLDDRQPVAIRLDHLLELIESNAS